MHTHTPPSIHPQPGLAQPAAGADANDYLAFCLGEQAYAVDIMDVQEIRNYDQPTRMVGASSYVRGVLNLRGSMVPIVDLRLRLGLHAGFDARTVIVVMNLSAGTVGVVVDAVSDVLALAPEDIQPMPAFSDSSDASLFLGLGCARHGDETRTLIVMNFQNLLPASVACPIYPL